MTRRRKALFAAVTVLGLILLAEVALRLAGYPVGVFRAAFTASHGRFEPYLDETIHIGPIPYRVTCNAQGFRGPDLRTGLDAAAVRIVAIGDSVTEGFYVDNDATYPRLLESALQRASVDAEVINAGWGGVSIDVELAVLRDVIVPLAPHIVILAFVTNDIGEIAHLSRSEVTGLSFMPQDAEVTQSGGFTAWAVTQTALGEAVIDGYLRLRAPGYRGHSAAAVETLDARYVIDGGTDYATNARLFEQRYPDTDGLILPAVLEPRVLAVFENYFAALDRFAAVCAEHDIRFLFVYVPAYSQIYLDDAPTTARDILEAGAQRRGIEFFDLTAALRAHDRAEPIHMAPVDWHFNPRGNALMGEAIARRLLELGWVKGR